MPRAGARAAPEQARRRRAEPLSKKSLPATNSTSFILLFLFSTWVETREIKECIEQVNENHPQTFRGSFSAAAAAVDRTIFQNLRVPEGYEKMIDYSNI